MTPEESLLSADSTSSLETETGQALRRRAEALAAANPGGMPENLEALLPDEARRTLHELRVHQIELEMQNEELRRTQEALELSRERYFDLYDLAPVGYFTLSEQGLVVEANLTGAKLLGTARSSLIQQPLSRFVLPEDQDTYYRRRRTLLETNVPQTWEMRVLKQNSAPFWVRVEAVTVQDVNGAPAWRAVMSDITDSKQAEWVLQSTNTELREFAYALTHDVQEPLRMVVNFTQLLAEEKTGKLGEDGDKYIGYAVDGALRIEALLRSLLNFWEATERGGNQFSRVDCNHLLSEALLSLRTAIQLSRAAVTFDPLPTIVASDVMLTQLFQNLIGNSIKYRCAATPVIHVSASKIVGGWMFSVKDNGVGIDPVDVDFVFGMFKRLHGKEIPGTGIGLALCKKVVERHGGRIWVESEAGRGSVFKFTIPTEGPA